MSAPTKPVGRGTISDVSLLGGQLLLKANGDIELNTPGTALLNGAPIATGGVAPTTDSFVTVTTEAGLTNSRRITSSGLVDLHDLGAGSDLVVLLDDIGDSTIIGNNTGSPGAPIALTAAQVRTLLSLAAIATTGSGADLVAGTVALSKLADIATSHILGRKTAGTGVPESLTASDVITILGLAAIATSGSGADLTAGSVTLAKLADIATAHFLGRSTAGTGVPESLTGTQATALLDAFTTSLKGLTPASGGGTVNFLRADGTWAAPPGTATGTNIKAAMVGLTTSNFNLPAASTTPINWDATSFDDSGFWSAGNPNRLTVPTGLGGAGTRFKVSGHVTVANIGSASVALQVLLRNSSGNRIAALIEGVRLGALGPLTLAGDLSIDFDAPADGVWWELVGIMGGGQSCDVAKAYDVNGQASFFMIEKVK